jgi:hypothetical protein
VDLGGVVALEGAGVLQPRDATEQPFGLPLRAVVARLGVGGQQVGADPDRRPVVRGDVRLQAVLAVVLVDPQAPRGRQDADTASVARAPELRGGGVAARS